jgi:hypothetical protein
MITESRKFQNVLWQGDYGFRAMGWVFVGEGLVPSLTRTGTLAKAKS